MFKSSLTVFFLILFAHSCNAHSLTEQVEPIEIPGENRESSVVETTGAIEVPDEDNGDKTNVGEKDFEGKKASFYRALVHLRSVPYFPHCR